MGPAEVLVATRITGDLVASAAVAVITTTRLVAALGTDPE